MWRSGAAMAALDLAGDPAVAAALVADGDWAAAVLSPLLARPDAAWPLAGRVAGDRATLMIERRADLVLAVTTLRPGGEPPGGVIAGGRQSFVRVLGGRGHLDRWEAGVVGADFSAATASPLGPRRSVDVTCGSALAIDGRREGHRFVPAEGGLILLTLTLAVDAAPLLRDYALPGGQLRRVAAAEGDAALAAMLVEVLGALGGGTVALAAASAHPAFFVRWAAMRHWLAQDARGAAPTLARMAVADPHPEVRAAALAAQGMLACPA